MITILCSGSRGDVQPYIALAQQLKKLSKEVRITAGSSFAPFVEGYGIEVFPLSADLETVDVDPQMLKDAGASDNPLKMLLTFNKMKRYTFHMTGELYKACEGSELIIYHPGCAIGHFAGQRLGIPSALASPFPMHKTSAYPSVIAYGRYHLPVKTTYALLQSMLWMVSKGDIHRFMKETFGEAPKPLACPYEKVDGAHPAVISCSNHVFPRPDDWDANVHQAGYWFVEEQEDYVPSGELADFLAAGEKPVYVGFGSVFNHEEKQNLQSLIIAALERCGRRGIIGGMGGTGQLTPDVYAVDAVPHTWLFGQVCAVCHHGGAGTTAAGFAAGVPSVIVPFSNDQFGWAHRAFDLGVGAKPIYKKKLTVDALAEGLAFALQDDIIANVHLLAQKLQKEHGARDIAKVLVDLPV